MKKNYIILPIFNDWKSLEKVLIILNKSFKNNKSSNHIIIVNDCSFNVLQRHKFKNLNNFKSLKLINLKKNVGSQKAIFFGLKYLQKKIKKKIKQTTISILDSDGEDNPKMLKKLIYLANKKRKYFIFASRKERTENIFFRLLNNLRLFLTYAFTGKFINFGNFSSFSSSILKKILINDNLYLAYSSGVLKNYKKIYLYDVKKQKRFYGNSKVNFKFLLDHSIKIVSIHYVSVFFRTLFLTLILFYYLSNPNLKILIFLSFIAINFILFSINFFNKTKNKSLSIIKSVKMI
jgi:polyisoprenyl-phosphate glycosyltransferase